MPCGHGSTDTHALQALHEDREVVLSHQQGCTEEGATRFGLSIQFSISSSLHWNIKDWLLY
ncbi:hypothetical protein C2845_PM06G00970 [Panicum miliaceum]|uniref:Uncharacterized protein n=1 Tax=Panicum miliaceum TaxID=4540 RepID=A0A3L6R6A8_PANMI|nr:hypothetical protein C2845_PM06G00970 [Panicum miliaceum]